MSSKKTTSVTSTSKTSTTSKKDNTMSSKKSTTSVEISTIETIKKLTAKQYADNTAIINSGQCPSILTATAFALTAVEKYRSTAEVGHIINAVKFMRSVASAKHASVITSVASSIQCNKAKKWTINNTSAVYTVYTANELKKVQFMDSAGSESTLRTNLVKIDNKVKADRIAKDKRTAGEKLTAQVKSFLTRMTSTKNAEMLEHLTDDELLSLQTSNNIFNTAINKALKVKKVA